MKKATKTTEPKVLSIKCAICGRETPHYVNSKGEVRCAICQTVAKKVEVKIPKEVEFEMDPELDDMLNGKPSVETEAIEVPEATEVPEDLSEVAE